MSDVCCYCLLERPDLVGSVHGLSLTGTIDTAVCSGTRVYNIIHLQHGGSKRRLWCAIQRRIDKQKTNPSGSKPGLGIILSNPITLDPGNLITVPLPALAYRP